MAQAYAQCGQSKANVQRSPLFRQMLSLAIAAARHRRDPFPLGLFPKTRAKRVKMAEKGVRAEGITYHGITRQLAKFQQVAIVALLFIIIIILLLCSCRWEQIT
jgi:hypothetical protein